jgi:cell division protease FtsH
MTYDHPSVAHVTISEGALSSIPIAASQDWQRLAMDLFAMIGKVGWAGYEVRLLATAIDAHSHAPRLADLEESGTEGRPPFTTHWRWDPTILLVVLRLARTFGTEAALRARFARPSQVLLVQTGQSGLEQAMDRTLQRITAAGSQRAFTAYRTTILPVTEAVRSGPSNAHRPFLDLSDSARIALLETTSLVLLAPVAALAPKAVRDLRPEIVTLAPLDTDILRAVLHLHYNVSPEQALSLNALRELTDTSGLSDLPLSRLSVDAFILALRAPDAAGAVAQIRTALSPASHGTATLADFPLPPPVRHRFQQMIAELRAWSSGALPWSQVTRGLLLAGPPGCGKTELARLLGQEAGLSVVAGSLGKWSSQGARGSEVTKAMRATFTKASEQRPALVFIDELDAFGDRKRAPDQNSSFTDLIVTALLELMDGFDGREGVVIMGATNHLSKIDAAIRRPGRFDTVLQLSHPTHEMMPQALRWHMGSDLPDIDLSTIAKAALGMSGADIAALVRSARAAARTERRAMVENDLMDALMALRPPLPPSLRWRVAVHEAGHAIVATATSGAQPKMLTIDSNGGGMRAIPAETTNTRAALEAQIAIGLAGRAAEELVLGAPSGGSGGDEDSDLAIVTRIAAAIEDSLGLGDTLVYLGAEDRAADRLRFDPQRREIVAGHLSRGHSRAKQILEANRMMLERLASTLNVAGVLEGEALGTILEEVRTETGAG